MEDRRSVFLGEGKKAILCDSCGGRCKYKAEGIYECLSCGATVMDDYGKVRTYLEKNGATSAAIIAEDTGVPMQVIEGYLRDGKLEIPEGSEFYITCQKCGKPIRCGRYCPSCAAYLSKNLQIQYGYVGEVPKSIKSSGKMRFFSGDDKK